jgi:diacylglycerol kinase
MKTTWSSFRVAFAGLWFFLRHEKHARWHALTTVMVVVSGAALGVTRMEWLALILATALVWVTEAVNTAIEHACDAITKEQNPLIGRAKDVAAGAVVLAAVFAAVVGAVVFLPRLSSMLTR